MAQGESGGSMGAYSTGRDQLGIGGRGSLLAILLFILYPFHISMGISGGEITLSQGDIIVGIIGCLWALGLIASYYLPPYLLYMGGFITVAVLSVAINMINPANYFNIVSSGVALLKLSGSIAWMVAVYLLGKEYGIESINIGLLASVVCAVVLTGVGIHQSLTTETLRPEVTFGNPNLFANYLMLNIFAALYLLPSQRVRWYRIRQMVSVLSAGILLLGVLNTGSRGALIGIGGMGATAILLALYRGRLTIKSTVIPTLLSIASSAVVLFYNPAIVARLTGSRNVEVRLTMWQVAIESILENPVIGIGYGQLSELLSAAVSLDLDPHNLYLLIAAETGVVGAIIFFGTLVLVIKDGIYTTRYSYGNIFLVAGLIGFLFQGLVTDIDNFRSLWILIGLIAIHKEQTTPQWSINLSDKLTQNDMN